MNGHRDEDEIAFCEARIQIVRRNPDRIKALASVLTLDNVAEDTRLKLWAICQLNEMHLAEADAELDRFARDISKLPEQSKMRQRMSLPGATIQELQNRRHPPIR